MRTPAFALTVYGRPAPQGSKRHVGGGRMIESSRYLAAWRAEVTTSAELVARDYDLPLSGPLELEAHFTLDRPKSVTRDHPHVKPDLSKLIRAIEDSLTVAGVWTDDALVTRVVSSKSYVGSAAESLPVPGVRIRVYPVTRAAWSARCLQERDPIDRLNQALAEAKRQTASYS